MIVADLPEGTRKVYYMIYSYADRYGLTFNEALEQIKQVAAAVKKAEEEVGDE